MIQCRSFSKRYDGSLSLLGVDGFLGRVVYRAPIRPVGKVRLSPAMLERDRKAKQYTT